MSTPYTSVNNWNDSFAKGQLIEQEVIDFLYTTYKMELVPYAYDDNNNPLYINDNSDFDFMVRQRNPEVPDLDSIPDNQKYFYSTLEIKSDFDSQGNIRAGNMTTLFFEFAKINRGKYKNETYDSGINASKANYILFVSVGNDSIYISTLEEAKTYLQNNYTNRNGITIKYSNVVKDLPTTSGYSVQFYTLEAITSPFKKIPFYSASRRQESIDACNKIKLEKDKTLLNKIKKETTKVNVRALF